MQRILQNEIGKLSTSDILSEMNALHVPAGKVKNLEEVFQNEDLQSSILKEEIAGTPTQRISSIAFRWE